MSMSNCVFNFNCLAIIDSETTWRSQIYIRGPCAPGHPPVKTFLIQKNEYFTTSNGVFNFNVLAPVVSKILGGPSSQPQLLYSSPGDTRAAQLLYTNIHMHQNFQGDCHKNQLYVRLADATNRIVLRMA